MKIAHSAFEYPTVGMIFLDDERKPTDVTWVEPHVLYKNNSPQFVYIVRDFSEFKQEVDAAVRVFKSSGWKLVYSFDHDLQCFEDGKEITGYDCLKYMLNVYHEQNIPTPVCVFHTQNPVGKENMKCYYENYKKFMEF